jgi:hypothetical protein
VRDWHEIHDATMQQNDPALLENLARELEAAIFFRFQELAHAPHGSAEHAELRRAVAELNSIRIVKLGWPDPRTSIVRRKTRKKRTSKNIPAPNHPGKKTRRDQR